MNVCVIGAGIFGIAAAVELRSRGHSVTVFERGSVPNENASSTDVAKSIRRWFYGDNETYLELVERSAAKWREWEERFGSRVYHQTGGIRVIRDFEPGTPMYQSVMYLRGLGADVRALSPQEARARFPQFVFRDDELCLHEPWNGYLESGRALSLLADLAREDGVEVREHTPVTRVEERGEGVKVHTEDGTWTFDLAVVAAGVWMGRLLPEIGRHLEVTHQQMVFIEVDNTRLVERGSMPVWSFTPHDELWYGFPLLREGYVKVSNDQVGETVDPDMDRSLRPEFVNWAMEFLRERIPEVGKGRVVGGRSCLFANSPDDHFVIDWVPGSRRTLAAGGGSSHGFKFGGSIGAVIADALEGKSNPLGDQFRIGDRLSHALKHRQKADTPGFAS